ncbi:MAG TPA: FAD-binding protein [Bellilinea sp.]|nr:FAD-binding protein [Bellilinea sp.]
MSNPENEPKLVSRRSFLKKTAMMSVGAMAGAALTSCTPKAGAGGSAAVEWDKEVDVLVVGSGTVATAAIAAKDAGAESVLIIEKGPGFGGTSALSGGILWIPQNYVMKEAGIEDNREDAYKYMKALTAEQSTDELIYAYLDNGPLMLEWLRDKFGISWRGGTINDYYHLPGNRPVGRSIHAVVENEDLRGMGLWAKLREICDQIGIEVMLDTAGKKLITNEAGEVIGVYADSMGSEIAIRAKRGVILGTGGFDHNKEMTTAFLRGPIYVSNAVNTNVGDGHLMGMAIGADLRNMNESWGLPSFPLDEETLKGEVDWMTYRGKPGAIVVNKYGERIGNESSTYDAFQRSFYFWDSGMLDWRNIPAYWIIDATYAEHYYLPGSNSQMGVIPDWITQADTLEELCDKLGIDWKGFEATLAVFNENAAAGVDPLWHRGEYNFDKSTAGDLSGKRTELKNNCLAPIEKGPFYGAKYMPGTCGTNGGLKINANGQVMNVWGQPIVGLYAVGNTSGSVMGAGYAGGGGTLGAGCVFGMLAGRHAATLETA